MSLSSRQQVALFGQQCHGPVRRLVDRAGHNTPGDTIHMAECPECAALAAQIGSVHAGLLLMRGQIPRQDLLARANQRALRFLRRVARATRAAERLRHARPQTSTWDRVRPYAVRYGSSAAAALLMILLRTGVFEAFDDDVALAERVVAHYVETYIDPGESMLA